MKYLGDFLQGQVVRGSFNTRTAAGVPITLAGTPALSVYKDGGTTETTTGVTLTVDFDSRTGHHVFAVDTADAFYASGSDFRVVITTGTVDGTSVVGTEVGSFSLQNRYTILTAMNSGFSSANSTMGTILTNIATLSGYVDTEVAAIKAKTDNLPSDPADASDIAASFSTVNSTLSTIASYIDTEVAAIKTKTDTIPTWPTNFSALAIDGTGQVTVGTNNDKTEYGLTAATITEIRSNIARADSLAVLTGYVDTEIAAIKTKTDTIPTWPTNFSALAISGGGAVTAGTVSDKTGYSLSQSFPSNFASMSIDGSGRVLLQPTQTGVTIPTVTTITNGVTVTTNNDKTGYVLSSGGVAAIEAALINEGDGQTLIDAIVTLINANLDLPALELAAIASAVRTELATELARLDATISSRLAASSYTAPDNATIASIAGYVDTEVAAIKAKTDTLPTFPTNFASLAITVGGAVTAGTVTDKTGYSLATAPPTASAIASQVRTELTTELGRIDVATSTRLASGSYTAPDNAGIASIGSTVTTIAGYVDTEVAAIKAKTDTIPSWPSNFASLAIDTFGQVNVAAIATDAIGSNQLSASAISEIQSGLATNSALSTVAGYIDTEVAAIKAKTDNLPASPAAVSDIPTATNIAIAVWANSTRTLSSFGTLVSDIATAVWSAVTRTITGGTVSTIAANAVNASALAADAVTEIQSGLATTVQLGAAKDEILEAVGSTGTGARTVLVTVTRSSLPAQNATVRLTKADNSESFVGVTDVDGEVTFNVDDATYTVAITHANSSFAGASLVVDGNETPTYALTVVSVPASTLPNSATGYLYRYDEENAVQAGVQFCVQLVSGPGDAGYSYDGPIRKATSGGDGQVAFTDLIRGATYRIWQGRTSQSDNSVTFVVPASGANFALPEVL